MATDQELIRSHVLDQRRRGLQESTIGVRIRFLRCFADWMGASGLLAATADDVERFLDSRPVTARTRAGYLSTVSVFYGWALKHELVERDPTVRIVRPKVRAGLPRPIGDSDLDLAMRLSSGTVHAMIALGAYAGMRCLEMARLQREDILEQRDPPVVLASGKGDKPRVIPLHEQVWDALEMVRMPRIGPVLRSGAGRPYTPWEISHIGNNFLHGLGIDATMHQLRHWFGTSLYRTSQKDLLMVRDVMGHSSTQTTQVYAQYDRAGAAAAINALHIRLARRETFSALTVPDEALRAGHLMEGPTRRPDTTGV